MDAERWGRVKRLFQDALELEPEERRAYVTAACAGDEELRAEVERMLAAGERAGRFMAMPLLESASRSDAGKTADSSELPLPQRLGAFRIVRELGRGGMGHVYLAEQDSPRRQVAIKVTRQSLMASDVFLRRFQSEQQILAHLEHPGIARLYAGGTTEEGQPYFVMEHVDGDNLLAASDRRRLSVRQRLQLFRRVCGAVQYAHEHLVVHRDLKPSNILVTVDGHPKLLDFGVAKLLQPQAAEPEAADTLAALRVLTPEYASPEQVRGEPVTTASDVYSLGVVLYELLTGRRPYRLKDRSRQEIESAVCEQEPARPSAVVEEPLAEPAGGEGQAAPPTPREVAAARGAEPGRLRRQLRGDLDTIVLQALHKRPAERYATAAALDEDLRRYLEGLPVRARPESFGYRLDKFVRRHRVPVAAALFALLFLVTGLGAALWQANRARAAQRLAERRFHDARALAHTLLFEAHDAVETLPGSIAARRLLIERALEYLDRMAAESEDDPALQLELADGYLRLGDLQGGRPFTAGLGEAGTALESYRKGLQLAAALAARRPGDAAVERSVGRLEVAVGRVLMLRGDSSRAAVHLRRGLAAVESLQARGEGGAEVSLEAAAARLTFGDLLMAQRSLEEALESYRGALALAEESTARIPDNRRAPFLAAVAHQRLAVVLQLLGFDQESLAEAHAYLADSRALARADPNDSAASRAVAVAQEFVSFALSARGEHDAAVATAAGAVGTLAELAARDPSNRRAEQDLAIGERELGRALLAAGRPAESLDHFRRGAAVLEAAAQRDAGDLAARGLVAGFHLLSGQALLALGAPEEALAALERSIAISNALIAADPAAFAEDRRDVAEAWYLVGECHERLTRADAEAERHRRAAAAAFLESRQRFAALHTEGRLPAADLAWLERTRAKSPGP